MMTQRGARAQDVDDAGRRVEAARGNRGLLWREHAAVEQEIVRRRAMSPERRAVEDAVRMEHVSEARSERSADQPRFGVLNVRRWRSRVCLTGKKQSVIKGRIGDWSKKRMGLTMR